MRSSFVCVLTAAVLAAGCPALAAAAAEKGPPLLTPVASRDLADACPGSRRFAQGLLTGITAGDAAAAIPLLEACAAQVRLPGFRWKSDVATLGVAAAELTRGLLTNDQTLLRRAASSSADLRAHSFATDEQVREWTEIPDGFSTRDGSYVDDYFPLAQSNASTERPQFAFGPWIQDAAYVHVAANLGNAWIHTPRTILGYTYGTPNTGGSPYPRNPTPYYMRTDPQRVSQ